MLNFLNQKMKFFLIWIIIFLISFSFIFYGFYPNKINKKDKYLLYNEINISFDMIDSLSNILKKNDIFNYNYFHFLKNDINAVSKNFFEKEVNFFLKLRNLKLNISEYNIKNFILNIPYFKQNGFFSNDLYKSVLSKNNLTEKEFYNFINKELLIFQLEDIIINSCFIIDEDFLLNSDNIYQSRECINVFFDKFLIFNDIFISNLDIEFYKNKFFSFEQIDISCIDLYLKDFYLNINYSDLDIKNYYDKYLNNYIYPKSINIRGCVIYYNKDYNLNIEYVKKLYNCFKNSAFNKDDFFKFLKFSNDKFISYNYGNMGYLYNGDVSNSFLENSIFFLKNGDISDLLFTDFGLYIVQILNKRDDLYKPYDFIFYDILNDYKYSLSKNYFFEKIEFISDFIFDNINLKDISEQIFIKERETYLFIFNRYNVIIGYNDIFKLVFNNDFILYKNFNNIVKINDEHYIIININKHWPSVIQNFYEYIYKIKYCFYNMRYLSFIDCLNNYLFKYLNLGINPYFLFKYYKMSFVIHKNICMNSIFSKYFINNLFNIILSKYNIWNSKNLYFNIKNLEFISLTNLINGNLFFFNLYDFLKMKNLYFRNYKNFEFILYKNYLINNINVKI